MNCPVVTLPGFSIYLPSSRGHINDRGFFMADIEMLLAKMIVQMTGADLVTLIRYAICLPERSNNPVPRATVNGVNALAEALSCSPSTIYALMRTMREEDGLSEGGGILRDAIVSRIGRRIVFDVELARALANKFKK